ncbi:MAG: DUF2892 domain-containing protein [Bacteroidetes bacterium]|nr:DUF2892 domain-containing protein [Bacteroidota bacterium]
MKKNIGKIDKTFRLLLGTAIIIIGAQLNSVWGIFGIIPIIISQIGICPIYLLLGLSTDNKVPVANKK